MSDSDDNDKRPFIKASACALTVGGLLAFALGHFIVNQNRADRELCEQISAEIINEKQLSADLRAKLIGSDKLFECVKAKTLMYQQKKAFLREYATPK